MGEVAGVIALGIMLLTAAAYVACKLGLRP